MMNLQERVERAMAMYFSGNRMPIMSGDPRDRITHPGRRLDLSAAASEAIAEVYRFQKENAAAGQPVINSPP